ncbi:hypothetical protein sos41_10350 [Alphaproteobacteria bacterium SO-S41]|nr:hypothetical protein sos41_10350 [Alphaproteobacteria bacterium SO-S41]
MRSFRNRLLAAGAAAALAGAAAAQDGSGIPRDPSQTYTAPTAPTRGGSIAVPLPPSGTIGNPTGPDSADTILPSDTPVAGQPGDFANPSDGAVDPSQPSILDTSREAAPTDLPYGEVATPLSRRQLEEQNHDMMPTTVEVEDLGTVDPSEKGTLDEAEGSLGGDLWGESDYPTIAELLEEMPVATASPAMNGLVRRVLLTGAKPKDANKSGATLFDIRTTRLAEAGLITDLVQLLDASGSAKIGDPAARSSALLLAGRETEACGASDDTDAGDGPALQLRAFCRLVAGDAAAASLSADLARVKGVDDPAFFALIAHLADGAPLDPAAVKALTPVTLALARKAKAPLTEAALDGAALGVAAALATDKATPSALRLAAAERAAAEGAIDAAALLDIFQAVKFKAADFAALAKATGAQGGALQVQNVIRTEGLEPRAKAIGAALAFAESRGLAALYSNLLARAAWETPPSAALAAYADDVTRVLLASGRGDRVADWLNLGNALAGALRDELTVRLALAIPSRDRAAAAAEPLARLARASGGDEALAARTLIYAGALDALGYDIPAEAQSLLQSSPLIAGPAAGGVETAELVDAAQAKRKGETILRALILIGRGGPAQAHPTAVIEAVGALSGVGLANEAVALALEAALARPRTAGGG